MVAALGAVGLVVGVAGGLAVLARADYGQTWEDWHDAEVAPHDPLGLLSIVVFACFFAGLVGFGLPPEARAPLVATPLGFFGVFLVEGARRWRRGPKPDPARIPGVGRWGRWVGKDLPEDVRPRAWPPSPRRFAAMVAAFVALGLVLDEGIDGLVALAVLGAWTVFVQSFVDQNAASRLLRRDRRTWEDEPDVL